MKKTLSFLLTLSLVLCMLAGCGSKEAETTAAPETTTAEMCGQVIYPAAVLNATKNQETAEAFLEYLKGDTADAVFEGVGFTPIA